MGQQAGGVRPGFRAQLGGDEGLGPLAVGGARGEDNLERADSRDVRVGGAAGDDAAQERPAWSARCIRGVLEWAGLCELTWWR